MNLEEVLLGVYIAKIRFFGLSFLASFLNTLTPDYLNAHFKHQQERFLRNDGSAIGNTTTHCSRAGEIPPYY